MDDLIIELEYNKELFLKTARHKTAKQRTSLLGFSVFCALLAIVLIVGNFINDNMQTASAGAFFAILGVAFLLRWKQLSVRNLKQTIEKDIAKFPLWSRYSFLQDVLLVETDFETSCISAEHEYSSIEKIHRIDEKTLCIVLKYGTYCAIESDDCEQIVEFLSGKVANECFNDSTDEQVKMIALLLCMFGGFIGLHQFYHKNVKLGVIYACTAGLFGVGWLIDLIRILQLKKPIGCKNDL